MYSVSHCYPNLCSWGVRSHSFLAAIALSIASLTTSYSNTHCKWQFHVKNFCSLLNTKSKSFFSLFWLLIFNVTVKMNILLLQDGFLNLSSFTKSLPCRSHYWVQIWIIKQNANLFLPQLPCGIWQSSGNGCMATNIIKHRISEHYPKKFIFVKISHYICQQAKAWCIWKLKDLHLADYTLNSNLELNLLLQQRQIQTLS